MTESSDSQKNLKAATGRQPSFQPELTLGWGMRGNATLLLMPRSLVISGESCKELCKTDTLGGCLWMAYAPRRVTSQSKLRHPVRSLKVLKEHHTISDCRSQSQTFTVDLSSPLLMPGRGFEEIICWRAGKSSWCWSTGSGCTSSSAFSLTLFLGVKQHHALCPCNSLGKFRTHEMLVSGVASSIIASLHLLIRRCQLFWFKHIVIAIGK